MKRSVVLLLFLTVCFSVISPMAAASDNSIVPFSYDERQVEENFEVTVSTDTMYVSVVGLVSNVYNYAEITSVNVTFEKGLFNAGVSINGNTADITLTDKVYHRVYCSYFVTISTNGTISLGKA